MESGLGKDHRHFRSRMDANVQNMFEINYSQLIQYEILEKLVTYIRHARVANQSVGLVHWSIYFTPAPLALWKSKQPNFNFIDFRRE